MGVCGSAQRVAVTQPLHLVSQVTSVLWALAPWQPQQSGAPRLELERKESQLFICAQEAEFGSGPATLPVGRWHPGQSGLVSSLLAHWSPHLHTGSCLTSPCKYPVLYTPGLSAITPVSFYWVFHGQPGCLELPTSSLVSQWRENTSSGTFVILPQLGPLALGMGYFIQTSPTASLLSVPERHRLWEAHWPGNLGSRLRPEIHGGSCPSEAPSNPPQHSRIGSGLQFGVEVEEVRCRIGCDGRHVPGRRSWTQSVAEDSVIGRGREMHQAGSHR